MFINVFLSRLVDAQYR